MIYTWATDGYVFLMIGTDDALNQAMLAALPGEPPPTPSPRPSAGARAQRRHPRAGVLRDRPDVGLSSVRCSIPSPRRATTAGRKRDRLARLLSVASILYSRGSGEAGWPWPRSRS